MTLPKFPLILRFYKPFKIMWDEYHRKSYSLDRYTEDPIVTLGINEHDFMDFQERLSKVCLRYLYNNGNEPIGVLLSPVDFATAWASIEHMGTVIDAKRKVFTVRIFGAVTGELPCYLSPRHKDIEVIADPKDLDRLYFGEP